MSKKVQYTPTLLWPRHVFENECLAQPLRAVNTVAQGCGGPIGLADSLARASLTGVTPGNANQARAVFFKLPLGCGQSCLVLLWRPGVLGPPPAAQRPCRPRTAVCAGVRRFRRLQPPSLSLPPPFPSTLFPPLRKAAVQVAELSPWSRTTPESSFCQQRIHGNPVLDPAKKGQREHGRFLRFPHAGQQSNVIRAGGAGKQKRTQVGRSAGRPATRGRWSLTHRALCPGHPRRRRPRDPELRPLRGLDRRRQPQRPAGVGRQHQDAEPGVPRPVPEHDQRDARHRPPGHAHREGAPTALCLCCARRCGWLTRLIVQFPGYAVHVVDAFGATATAEVFLNGRSVPARVVARGAQWPPARRLTPSCRRLVLPGMKSPGGLKRALGLICEIVRPHLV